MFRFPANSNDQKFHKLLKVRAYAFSFLISSCSKLFQVSSCCEVFVAHRLTGRMAWWVVDLTNLLHDGAWSEQFQWISQIISSLDFISHLDFICNSLIFHDWNLLFKFPHAFILQTSAILTLIFKRLSKIDFDIQKIDNHWNYLSIVTPAEI